MMQFSRAHCAMAPRNHGCNKGAYASRPGYKRETIKSRVFSAAQALLAPSAPEPCPIDPDFTVSPRQLKRFTVSVLLVTLGCYSLREYFETAGHIDNEHHWPQVETPSDDEMKAAGWPFTTTTTPALQEQSTPTLQEESIAAVLPATIADSLPAAADSSIAAEAAAGLVVKLTTSTSISSSTATTTLQANPTPALPPATVSLPAASDSSIAAGAAAALAVTIATSTALLPAVHSSLSSTASHTCVAADSKPLAARMAAAGAAATPTIVLYAEADSSSECAAVSRDCCSTLHLQQADAAGAEGHTCHSLAPTAGKAKQQLLALQQPPAGCDTAAELAGAPDTLPQQHAVQVHLRCAATAAVVVGGGGGRRSITPSSWLGRVACKLFSCGVGSSLSRVDWL
uniref:Uncharacterized protein n=1 Tax=Tetradesmus obliquus TaxID=3088 RepID=A0A383VG40_TETOB|eukprot:jgi/Sobl393_1/5533/SZX63634.1